MEGDCWLWPGSDNGNGYGKIRLDGRSVYVHRFVHEWLVGPIPLGATIDHVCRVTRCCNPDHLEPVSLLENLRRSPLTRASINSAKTECPRGHPYDEENTYYHSRPDGRPERGCRRCRSAAVVKTREKAKATSYTHSGNANH